MKNLYCLLLIIAFIGCNSINPPSDNKVKAAVENGEEGFDAFLKKIELPAGFKIELYAEDVPNARSMCFSPDGTLFVGTRGAGNVYALKDTDGDFKIDKKTAFVFGAEATGISDTVKENADGFLKIPMVGFTESFNISVAAAIILQEVTTRLKTSNIKWQLSSLEKETLYLQWIKETIKNVDKIEERYHLNLKNE